jgi:hypothetical protein
MEITMMDEIKAGKNFAINSGFMFVTIIFTEEKICNSGHPDM